MFKLRNLGGPLTVLVIGGLADCKVSFGDSLVFNKCMIAQEAAGVSGQLGRANVGPVVGALGSRTVLKKRNWYLKCSNTETKERHIIPIDVDINYTSGAKALAGIELQTVALDGLDGHRVQDVFSSFIGRERGLAVVWGHSRSTATREVGVGEGPMGVIENEKGIQVRTSTIIDGGLGVVNAKFNMTIKPRTMSEDEQQRWAKTTSTPKGGWTTTLLQDVPPDLRFEKASSSPRARSVLSRVRQWIPGLSNQHKASDRLRERLLPRRESSHSR